MTENKILDEKAKEKAINNIELIKPLLDFKNDGDFFMLYIFCRKKDQADGEKQNHQSVRTIKTYCISSIDHLDSRYDEIKALCELFKARAYIHVQRQNHKDVGMNMMVELATRLKDGAVNQHNLFDSVVGQLKVYEKRWIIDIDTKDRLTIHRIAAIINMVEPTGDKIIAEIPTKNGAHLITDPFNVQQFNQHPDKNISVDIQKKNPTLLYCPATIA